MANLSNINNKFLVTTGGNVGIGVTGPLYRLEVSGSDFNFVGKFQSTGTGYAPASILLESTGSASRGQGMYHYNTTADENWFTGVPYNVNSKKWIVANQYSTSQLVDTAQLTHALMTIDSDTGNVGIGVSSPVGKLQVSLPTYTNEDTNSQQAIFGVDSGYGVRIGYNETDNKGYINVLKPGVAWGSLILQEDIGKVGIGTDSPQRPLHVNGTEGVARFTSTASGNNGFEVGIGTSSQAFLWQSENAHMEFATNNAERMRITSGGDIDVQGGDIFLNSGTNYNDKGVVYLSNERTAIISDIVNATANGDTSLDFQTRKGGTRASAMFIDEFRSVGIGTTSPGQPLHVVGNIKTFGHLFLQSNANGFRTVALDTADGSDNQELYLCGGGTASTTRGGQVGVYGNEVSGTGGSVVIVAGNVSTGDIDFLTANTQRMIINNAGNVSVGDTTAQRRFNVIDPTDAWIRISSSNYASDWLIGTAGSSASFKIYSQSAAALRFNIDGIGRMGFNYGIETDVRHYFYSNNNTGAATGVAKNVQIHSTQYAGTHVQFKGSQGNGGNIGYSNQTASYNVSGSDERLKKNITNWDENILDKFKDIQPKEFHFNQQDDSEEKQKGYIAQNEVDKFPEAYPLLYDDVSKEDRHQFNPSGMVVYLMKAIQELKAEIELLKSK